MKALVYIFILSFTLVACTQVDQQQPLTLNTVVYPPYVNDAKNGLVIDLVTAAFKTQNTSVTFKIYSLDEALTQSETHNKMMLGSRMLKKEGGKSISRFVQIYESFGNLISISGRKENKLVGVFGNDELDYVKANNIPYIQYSSYEEGLKWLYDGKVGRIACSDIGCEQIEVSNPDLTFNTERIYDFPIDVVTYEEPVSDFNNRAMDVLQLGMTEIINTGVYSEILEGYKVESPLFHISIGDLDKIKTAE